MLLRFHHHQQSESYLTRPHCRDRNNLRISRRGHRAGDLRFLHFVKVRQHDSWRHPCHVSVSYHPSIFGSCGYNPYWQMQRWDVHQHSDLLKFFLVTSNSPQNLQTILMLRQSHLQAGNSISSTQIFLRKPMHFPTTKFCIILT